MLTGSSRMSDVRQERLGVTDTARRDPNLGEVFMLRGGQHGRAGRAGGERRHGAAYGRSGKASLSVGVTLR
jgi:hypothetical protein